MSEKLLNQKEACAYLNISRTTILRWENNKLIEPIRTIGRHGMYEKEGECNQSNSSWITN